MRRSKSTGGHKAAIDPAVREEALRIAASRGPDAAAKALGLRPGTVRSWVRRARLRELRSRPIPGGGLEELKRIGQEMLARDASDPAPEQDRQYAGRAEAKTDEAVPAPEPELPRVEAVDQEEPASSRGPKRRKLVFWGDEAAEVPEREPEPDPPDVLSEKQRRAADERAWKMLGQGGGVVASPPPADRYDDATGLPRYERGREA
jgi:transposase-like protein